MKKLFLTSGLVLCMAGQAYASTPITYNNNAYGASGCNYTYLDTYDTSSSLEAIWDAVISGAIALDSNRYAASGDSTAASTASTAAALSPVYSKYNTGIYSSVANAEAGTNAITALSTQPVMTGYTFAGFYTGKAGSGTQVVDSSNNYLPAATTQISTAEQSATWYAHWTAKSCNISYNPTAHSTNPSASAVSSQATYDSAYSIPNTAVTLSTPATGYAFVGWTTSSSPSVTRTGATTGTVANAWTWTNGTNWNSESCPTVYAAYIAKQYNVTYAVGTCGGSDKTYNNALTYDANYTVLGPGATGMTVTVPTGYTFNGWTESLAGNATRSEGDQYQPWQTDSNLTLTAQCSANSTKVAYNCGNSRATTPVAGTWTTPGTGTWTQVVASGGAWVASNNSGIYAQTATYDSAFTHPTGSSVCSLSGYTFNAWVCVTGTTSATTGGLSNDGLGTGADANKWKTNAAAVTCTATWTPNHITLNWNKNGADSADIAATACDYDGSITLPTAPTRNGYTFQGWTVCPTAHGTAGTVQNGVCTNTACESGYHVSNGACVAD